MVASEAHALIRLHHESNVRLVPHASNLYPHNVMQDALRGRYALALKQNQRGEGGTEGDAHAGNVPTK